jgi:hypothetical protein
MRKILALAFMLPPVAVLFAACGGDDTATQPTVDASTETSLVDKKPIPPDTTPTDTSTQSCAPGDTSAFTPNWVPPVSNPDACTDVQIKDFFAACYDANTKSTQACQAWTKVGANVKCFGCLDTPETATSYGALVEHKGYVTANVAGCEALVTEDTSSTGCAAKLAAENDCTHFACETNCPLTSDPQSFTDFSNCLNNAPKTACKSYVSALCADAGADISVCTSYSAFKDYYFGLAPIFCGGKPAIVDGGTDASDGAIVDAGPG